MIPTQLWRARMELFNTKRHYGGSRSSELWSQSSPLLLALLPAYSAPTIRHGDDSPPGSNLPSPDHSHDRAIGCSCENHSNAILISHKKLSIVIRHTKLFSVRLNSEILHCLPSSLSTERLSSPCDLLKKAMFVLLIHVAIVSQLLILSGDIETNPGPIACEFYKFKEVKYTIIYIAALLNHHH